MLTYPIPFVPGPVSIPEQVRAAYQIDYGSADMEDEFFALYALVRSRIAGDSGHAKRYLHPDRRGHDRTVGRAQERASARRPRAGGLDRPLRRRHRRHGAERRRAGGDPRLRRQRHRRHPAGARSRPALPPQDDHRRSLRDAQRHAQSAGRTGRDLPGGGCALLRRLRGQRRRRPRRRGCLPDRPGSARQPEGAEPDARSLHDQREPTGLGRRSSMSTMPATTPSSRGAPRWPIATFPTPTTGRPWPGCRSASICCWTRGWTTSTSATPMSPPTAVSVCSPWGLNSSRSARRSARRRSRRPTCLPAGRGRNWTAHCVNRAWLSAATMGRWRGRSSASGTWDRRRIGRWRSGGWMCWRECWGKANGQL